MLGLRIESKDATIDTALTGINFWKDRIKIEELYSEKYKLQKNQIEQLLFWQGYKEIEEYLLWGKTEKNESLCLIANISQIPNLLKVQISTKQYLDTLAAKVKTQEEREQEAFMMIASEFGDFETVQSIYIEKFREEIKIYIPLSIDKYNYELMDELFDIEYEIRKSYSEFFFEFFYPPAGSQRERDFIHPEAECIFSK